MAHKGGSQNEATRRATRRNYALFQSMGASALMATVAQAAQELGGEGAAHVVAQAIEAKRAVDGLIETIIDWSPNK